MCRFHSKPSDSLHASRQVLLLASVAAHDGGPGRLAPVSDWCAAVQGGDEGGAGRHPGPDAGRS